MTFGEVSEIIESPQIKEAFELPDFVELLERTPEAWEPQEARIETWELDSGLEMDTRTREEAEVQQEAPYEYSQAYTDSQGIYHPGQIIGVYKDSLENPVHRETAESLKGWQHQERMMSCAVQVQRQIINKQFGANVSEAELRQIAKELDLYTDERGTYRKDIGKLTELFNMEREQPKNPTSSDLIAARLQGEELIVAVDSVLLERPYLPKTTMVNHVVEVLDFDFSDSENPKVIINDPGRTEGRGSVYLLSDFERAACRMNQETGEQTYISVTKIQKKEAQ